MALGLLLAVPGSSHAQEGPGAESGPPEEQVEQTGTPLSLRWGPDRLGLIRYNRVEGLSVGVRAAALTRGSGAPVTVVLSARLRSSGPRPDARLELERVTLRRRFGLAAYSELVAADPAADPLGPVASLLALVAGRDDGDYYQRSGGGIWWASPPGAAVRFRVGAHSAYHEALSTQTGVALPRLWDGSWRYPANMVADEGWEHGLEAGLTVLLGRDPRRIRGGVEVSGLAAAGAAEFTRASATARVGMPVGADFHVGLEGSGGASAGAVSEQRLWALGGPATLRGFVPRARLGRCFWRGHAEVAYALPLGDVVVFSDVGDAGTCGSAAGSGGSGRLPGSDVLASVGGGVFLVDRTIRLSAAWAWEGTSSRVDLIVMGSR